jgi:hypothetical protein
MLPLASEAIVLIGAGVFAGFVGAIVGSGTLVTFPALLFVGYSPVTANVSNGLGIVPGSVTGAWGYRQELDGQQRRLVRLVPACAVGALIGAGLLLTLPAAAFAAIVPVLIAVAVLLVLVQPWLNRQLQHHAIARPDDGGRLAVAAACALGIYGGYFGGGLGILALGALAVVLPDQLQRINAMKVVMVLIANLISGIAFVFLAHVAWTAVAFLAIGSALGGQLGSRFGRRWSPILLRCAIVVVGIAALAKSLL